MSMHPCSLLRSAKHWHAVGAIRNELAGQDIGARGLPQPSHRQHASLFAGYTARAFRSFTSTTARVGYGCRRRACSRASLFRGSSPQTSRRPQGRHIFASGARTVSLSSLPSERASAETDECVANKCMKASPFPFLEQGPRLRTPPARGECDGDSEMLRLHD
jgi:hypothetical protein